MWQSLPSHPPPPRGSQREAGGARRGVKGKVGQHLEPARRKERRPPPRRGPEERREGGRGPREAELWRPLPGGVSEGVTAAVAAPLRRAAGAASNAEGGASPVRRRRRRGPGGVAGPVGAHLAGRRALGRGMASACCRGNRARRRRAGPARHRPLGRGGAAAAVRGSVEGAPSPQPGSGTGGRFLFFLLSVPSAGLSAAGRPRPVPPLGPWGIPVPPVSPGPEAMVEALPGVWVGLQVFPALLPAPGER